MNEEQKQLGEVAVWLGIVEQLYTTRMNQHLSRQDLTIGQFAMLNHLSRHEQKQHTITELTAALEVNQPGVTKIVKKLSGMGLLAVERDSADSRKRLVSITTDGFGAIGRAIGEIGPDIAQWFADWSAEDMATFLAQLQKLGGWMDSNRLDT